MTTLQRTIEFLSLSVWLGGGTFLFFVVAPGAFFVLDNDAAAAGAMVRYALNHLHVVGAFCGLVFLVTRLMRTGTFRSLLKPASLSVMTMLALTITSQYTVIPVFRLDSPGKDAGNDETLGPARRFAVASGLLRGNSRLLCAARSLL